MANRRVHQHLSDLHGAILDLMVFMNEPERDETMVREAGLSLDRALFPLLVAIDRFGPLGIGDLADRVGRDHTTVSRHVAKLAEQGLVLRSPGVIDRRINEAVLTDEGRRFIHALKKARERMAGPVLEKWSEADFSELVRLLRRLVGDLNALPRT